jgi:AcrR family transcriptional regulator
MNHLPIGGLAAVAQDLRPNQRALAKQRTREKILAAAKALFAQRGYEGATIRDIAGAAGMSTGAVFASFTDKSDLFIEIAETENGALHAAMSAAAKGLAGRAAIGAMLDAAAAWQLAEAPLFQAVMGALWTPGLAEKVRRRLDRRSVSALLVDPVGQELACGKTPVDAGQIAELIWTAHTALVRRAALDRLSPEVVKTRSRDQLRIILAGARRG